MIMHVRESQLVSSADLKHRRTKVAFVCGKYRISNALIVYRQRANIECAVLVTVDPLEQDHGGLGQRGEHVEEVARVGFDGHRVPARLSSELFDRAVAIREKRCAIEVLL